MSIYYIKLTAFVKQNLKKCHLNAGLPHYKQVIVKLASGRVLRVQKPLDISLHVVCGKETIKPAAFAASTHKVFFAPSNPLPRAKFSLNSYNAEGSAVISIKYYQFFVKLALKSPSVSYK